MRKEDGKGERGRRKRERRNGWLEGERGERGRGRRGEERRGGGEGREERERGIEKGIGKGGEQ